MSPIATTAARMVRASAAPVRAAAAVRQYSAAAGGESTTAAGLHSTKKLTIASGVAFAVGVDATYAYFTLTQKKEDTA